MSSEVHSNIDIVSLGIDSFGIRATRPAQLGRFSDGEEPQSIVREEFRWWCGYKWVTGANISRAKVFSTHITAQQYFEEQREKLEQALPEGW